MKKFMLFCLVLIFILPIVGCTDNVEETVIIQKSYVYEKGGFSGIENDNFILFINEDGTFTYTEGIASSHVVIPEKCSWKYQNGILTLTETMENNNLVNHFKVKDDGLYFQAENSTGFIYTEVFDGDRFIAIAKEPNDNKTPLSNEEIIKIVKATIDSNSEKTIIDLNAPDIQRITLQDDTLHFYKLDEAIDLNGKEVYKVTFRTTVDELLGPIVYYVDCYTGQIYGMDYRE